MEPDAIQSSPGESDGTLIARTLAGDRKAYDTLIGADQRQAVAVSYRLLGNYERCDGSHAGCVSQSVHQPRDAAKA